MMQPLSKTYPVWFCDVWGVLHNGQEWFRPATEALTQHRLNGGLVVLLTNSPRTSAGVIQQLRHMGVPDESYDLVVTSGDVTQTLVTRYADGRVFHLGPLRDISIFDGLAVSRVTAEKARAVLCTGLRNDATETPADYANELASFRQLSLPFICANPDKIVKRGAQIIYCAGALAEAYANLGGDVLMAGKPFAPIYDLAMRLSAERLGRSLSKAEVLAIGDGPDTDIKGAADYGLATVLIADGVIDASAGLAAVEAHVKQRVPQARILQTLAHLQWA